MYQHLPLHRLTNTKICIQHSLRSPQPALIRRRFSRLRQLRPHHPLPIPPPSVIPQVLGSQPVDCTLPFLPDNKAPLRQFLPYLPPRDPIPSHPLPSPEVPPKLLRPSFRDQHRFDPCVSQTHVRYLEPHTLSCGL